MRYGFDKRTAECRQFQYGLALAPGATNSVNSLKVVAVETATTSPRWPTVGANALASPQVCRKWVALLSRSRRPSFVCWGFWLFWLGQSDQFYLLSALPASLLFPPTILPIPLCPLFAAPLSPNICEHRIDQGKCSGAFQRFGYDQDTNRCTKFVYGGCGGNGKSLAPNAPISIQFCAGNNFATLEDCRAACVRVQCPPEPDCDLGRCQLVRDAQGCPLCSCPPPRHPPLVSGPPTEGRGQCPSLDVHLCQEPCIMSVS